eukprot:TRINITY_DN1603_c0_g1_i5.p1 TRINITY_DN1603_c0_g1~~TRINITY_DN1603_c0_g1_i5.p1  ORF type:complete len:298 (+),score=101.92 TRINITY_DN1603_c0_g1_i5:53-895(+)
MSCESKAPTESCCPPGSYGYLEPQGNEVGRKTTAGDVEVYETGTVRKSLLLFIPDVWGWNTGRVRSIADDFAKRGHLVVIPKVLPPFEGGTDGDALPPNFNISERFGDVMPLLKGEWGPGAVVPKLVKVLEHYKEKGVEKAAVYGFCYGGWIGFHLASEKQCVPIVCGVSSHPSIHLEGVVGGDPTELAKKQTCPWLFQPAGVPGAKGADPEMYDAEGSLVKELEALFPGKNKTVRYCQDVHGFVVRMPPTGFAGDEGERMKAAITKAIDEAASFLEAVL